MIVSVIGLGKAGLPLASAIADSGIEVLGVDIDKNRVAAINSGTNPIPQEPGLDALIHKHGGKNLRATTDSKAAARTATVHIIIVPVFIDEKKQCDFSLLQKAVENIGAGLKKEDAVILETTVPVGTTENLVVPQLERFSKLKAGIDFYVAYSPERIMTGFSLQNLRRFPKLIGGINPQSAARACEVYAHFTNPRNVTDAKTAELAKIAEGIYRDVNIALANEMYKIAGHYGINYFEIREVTRHEFCNFLEPGNVGGHCIPVYPWFIINQIDAPLIRTARRINDDMIEFYLQKINKLPGTKVALIGLSYREGVKEKAYSRSIALIELLKKNKYTVYGLDPLYSAEEIKTEFGILPINPDDLPTMDSIVLLNKETQYNKILLTIKDKVIDIKNVLG